MKETLFFIFFIFLNLNSLMAENFTFKSQFFSTSSSKNKEETLLEGDVVISSKTKVIKADKVLLKGKDLAEFYCSGNVSVDDNDQELRIESESLIFNNNLQKIKVQGDSLIEDKKNNLLIRSSYFESREKEKLILLQIGVRIFKDDMVCRSEFALYDRDKKELDLTGFPIVYKGEDIFRASRIIVNIDDDSIKMEGDVKGSLFTESDAEPKTEPKVKKEDKPNE